MSLPSMLAFGARFPDLAARETRVIELPYAQGGLPAGSYGFLELYCNDPACDCRRVVLQVCSEAAPDTVLATINYGWENAAFYKQWLHGDHTGGGEIKEASLDPLNPQSRFAPAFLRLFRTAVLQDQSYIERLKRHYTLFKQHTAPGGGSPGGPPAAPPAAN